MAFFRSTLNSLEKISKDVSEELSTGYSFLGKDMTNSGVREIAESFASQGLQESQSAVNEENSHEKRKAIENYKVAIATLWSYLEYESRFTHRLLVRRKIGEYATRVSVLELAVEAEEGGEKSEVNEEAPQRESKPPAEYQTQGESHLEDSSFASTEKPEKLEPAGDKEGDQAIPERAPKLPPRRKSTNNMDENLENREVMEDSDDFLNFSDSDDLITNPFLDVDINGHEEAMVLFDT